MSAAEWDANEGLARVLRSKGNDLQSVGHFRKGGQQWLRPEEALCLIDDGTLLLIHKGDVLSAQAARALLFGPHDVNSLSKARHLQYKVFCSLHRNGYVCRMSVRPAENWVEHEDDPVFVAAYERRGFSRRAVDRDGAPPAFVVACFWADGPLPRAHTLRGLARRCSPTPLRCACVKSDEVLFLDVVEGIQLPKPSAEKGAVEFATSSTISRAPGEGASPPASPPSYLCNATILFPQGRRLALERELSLNICLRQY